MGTPAAIFWLCLGARSRRPGKLNAATTVQPHSTVPQHPRDLQPTPALDRSIGRGGVMEAKCLAIAHAELGGIAVQRAAHCRPHLLEDRTMTSNMMSSPPRRSHALGLPKGELGVRNGAMWCAARKECDGGQAGADRGEIGGKD
eukprot:scaffold15730_cov65-Phaeocystis_antarctica.AAC.9